MIRQREQYQGVISLNERKLIEANQRLAYVQQTEDKRAAAEYLVQQIQMAGEEKQSLIMELDNNHLKMQELSDEYARLMNECKNYLSFKQNPTVPPGKPFSQESVMQAQQKLLLRIEELEDLVIELKNQQRPTEIIDMKTILLSKE